MSNDLLKSELEDKILQNREELNTLKQIVKAQKFEIENDIFKKTKNQ